MTAPIFIYGSIIAEDSVLSRTDPCKDDITVIGNGNDAEAVLGYSTHRHTVFRLDAVVVESDVEDSIATDIA